MEVNRVAVLNCCTSRRCGLTSADTTAPTLEVVGALNCRDDPAELRPECVVTGEGIRTFEAFAMDLQTNGGEPVTSDDVCPPNNFHAYSPQPADHSRLQPDIPASKSRSLASRLDAHSRASQVNRASPQTHRAPRGRALGLASVVVKCHPAQD